MLLIIDKWHIGTKKILVLSLQVSQFPQKLLLRESYFVYTVISKYQLLMHCKFDTFFLKADISEVIFMVLLTSNNM